MQIRIKKDSVEIDGYVNAIERNSKPLISRMGKFIERISKGAFSKALKRNEDVHVLLNHDWQRDLGSTKQGNLSLTEDNIGLKALATIYDADVIEKARRGDLVGWSFGFNDRDVEKIVEHDMLTRVVNDLDLYEVSILDRTKSPAYDGTLITVRSDGGECQFRSEPFIDEVVIKEERACEEPEKPEEKPETGSLRDAEEQPKQQEVVKIDYSEYEQIIKKMKGEN